MNKYEEVKIQMIYTHLEYQELLYTVSQPYYWLAYDSNNAQPVCALFY